ncbi:hypothetical protein HGQ98_05200 [Achromobacter ruhlandii]|uniref:Uncharacterized protein n=1 Tax=Achromobacter ruhlandii TaxID=72557 RepID=A0A848NCL0_9BURK|nr:hypothetical protein [Achromobacter ruhlandii]NMU89276.1 hypothetical protein [Achromobacter ruhlandii]
MYQLVDDLPVVKRLSDGYFVPINPVNPDYQVYLSWLDAGNTPAPADEATVAPSTVIVTRDFLQRFRREEYAAARSSYNMEIQWALDNMIAAQFIDTTDPGTLAGLALMVAEGVLTEARRIEVLGTTASADGNSE